MPAGSPRTRCDQPSFILLLSRTTGSPRAEDNTEVITGLTTATCEETAPRPTALGQPWTGRCWPWPTGTSLGQVLALAHWHITWAAVKNQNRYHFSAHGHPHSTQDSFPSQGCHEESRPGTGTPKSLTAPCGLPSSLIAVFFTCLGPGAPEFLSPDPSAVVPQVASDLPRPQGQDGKEVWGSSPGKFLKQPCPNLAEWRAEKGVSSSRRQPEKGNPKAARLLFPKCTGQEAAQMGRRWCLLQAVFLMP